MNPRRRLRSARSWLHALSCGVLLAACGASRPPPLAGSSVEDAQLLPTGVRRLSNVEIERSASALLGVEVSVAERLPPDVRQAGYSPNAAQPMPTASAVTWSALVAELAHEATAPGLQRFIACESAVCQGAFITTTAKRAFRRPPTRAESAALQQLFTLGANEGGTRRGVELVLGALLESPSFLYLTELGDPDSGEGPVRLTDLEIASLLSYTLSGAPPDERLVDSALDGGLRSAEQRRAEARHILARSSTRHHFRRFVLEWLEVDGLESTAKDTDQHPTYEALKSHMLAETRAFVDEVMVHHGASVQALLTAGFASVGPEMARYYGLEAYGAEVSLESTGRLGVLQHASFLASHAHPDGTSPVKRGDFVLRQVLCKQLPRPAELGIETVMPAPEPGRTTRRRFEQHVADPSCITCHQSIDPLGFTFETFDAAGRTRATDNGRPIDSRTSFPWQGAQQRFADSADLSRWLATRPEVVSCFARQAFRYFSAQSEPATERAFLRLVDELPEERRGSLIDLAVAYVSSDYFIHRQVTP